MGGLSLLSPPTEAAQKETTWPLGWHRLKTEGHGELPGHAFCSAQGRATLCCKRCQLCGGGQRGILAKPRGLDQSTSTAIRVQSGGRAPKRPRG